MTCCGCLAQAYLRRVEDRKALAELAELADIVAYEREQLPLASVTWLSERVAVAPNCCPWKSRKTEFEKVILWLYQHPNRCLATGH